MKKQSQQNEARATEPIGQLEAKLLLQSAMMGGLVDGIIFRGERLDRQTIGRLRQLHAQMGALLRNLEEENNQTTTI